MKQKSFERKANESLDEYDDRVNQWFEGKTLKIIHVEKVRGYTSILYEIINDQAQATQMPPR